MQKIENIPRFRKINFIDFLSSSPAEHREKKTTTYQSQPSVVPIVKLSVPHQQRIEIEIKTSPRLTIDCIFYVWTCVNTETFFFHSTGSCDVCSVDFWEKEGFSPKRGPNPGHLSGASPLPDQKKVAVTAAAVTIEERLARCKTDETAWAALSRRQARHPLRVALTRPTVERDALMPPPQPRTRTHVKSPPHLKKNKMLSR